jgi:GAF domain-containing protein
MAGQELLANALSEFARELARDSAIGDVLNHLAARLAMVLGIAGAGVSVLESGQVRFAAASDERSAALERVQEAAQAGPSMEAYRTGRIVIVEDLPEASCRWDQYEQAARDSGVVAVASVPMRHGGKCIGTVDLHSTARREWSADDLAVAGVLTDMAAACMVHAREVDRQSKVNEQLHQALESRIVIEQAKGVLAAEQHMSVDEAFEVLRRYARSHNAALRSVCQAVVTRGLRP